MECSLAQCEMSLAALEELAAQNGDRADFYQRWSAELVTGLSFSAVAVFHEVRHKGGLRQTAIAGDGMGLSRIVTPQVLRRSLACFRETKSGPVHLVGGAQWTAAGFSNTSDREIFVLPLLCGTEIIGVVFATRKGQCAADTRETLQQALLAAVGIAEGLEVSVSKEMHVADDQWWQRVDGFLEEALAARGSRQLARVLANTGAHLLHCERVTIVDVGAFGGRVLATTGVSQINSASPVARQAALLAVRVARYGEPLDVERNDLAPDLEVALADYVDLVASKQIAAVPLAESREWRPRHQGWIMILEPLPDSDWTARRPHLEQFLRYARQAVATTRYYESLPLFSLSCRMGRVGALVRTPRIIRRLVGTMALVAVVLLVACIPVPLSIQARGTIQPVVRQHLFAPADGVITAVSVREGDAVSAGTMVLTMRRHEIHQKVGGLMGQLETLEAQLKSEQRLQLYRARGDEDQNAREASLRIRQLKTSIASVQSQLEMARDEADTLAVRAPFSGTVLSRAPTAQLLGRPVFQGQLLLSLAALESDWELELEVGEHEIRHVVSAQQERTVLAEFLCAADLEKRYPAKLRVLEKSAVVEEGREAHVRAVLDVTTKPGKVPPGTQVVAHLKCGKRALGFVLFRRLMDAVSYSWLF
ncbi:MAG: hypothetical protein VX346_09995 [Planctomycetota bacterium]|nr:hypothetical protein [Planctomycetota bacterium]